MADIQILDCDADKIQPVKISHHVDEIRERGRLLECYNYVVYEFENKDAYLLARTYLDEVDKVAIYGPFTDRGQTTKAGPSDLEAAAMDYLKRRFHRIERLNPDKNAPHPYETIWSRSAAN